MRALLLALLVAAAGCIGAPGPEPTPTPPPPAVAEPLVVASVAFEDGGTMPEEHTCDGADVSPALAFANAPGNATHLAVLMYDPDAPLPQAPARNITHWLLWNVPLVNGSAALDEGAVPSGARQGANERGENAYMGPCPPQLSPPHRYVFWTFALDAPLDLAEGATRAQLEAALEGHVLAEGALVGMYARAVP